MDTILKKADCCSHNTFNSELVAKIMNVLMNLRCVRTDTGLHKKLDEKFTAFKNEFFTAARFPNINYWKLQNTAIYMHSSYNIAIYSLAWGGAFECPFKKTIPDVNNTGNNYDGYDYGDKDIILYNLSNKEHVILNTWHIHAMYYHNNLGTEQFKMDLEKLATVLQPVIVSKMNIVCKHELVYDNVLAMAHNQHYYMMDYKPNVKQLSENSILMSVLIKSDVNREQFNKLLSMMQLKKKCGNVVFGKDLLHMAIFNKDDVYNNNHKADATGITNISNCDRLLVDQYIYETYGIKLVMDEGLYKYNIVNKCFPIMKDVYYYQF